MSARAKLLISPSNPVSDKVDRKREAGVANSAASNNMKRRAPPPHVSPEIAIWRQPIAKLKAPTGQPQSEGFRLEVQTVSPNGVEGGRAKGSRRVAGTFGMPNGEKGIYPTGVVSQIVGACGFGPCPYPQYGRGVRLSPLVLRRTIIFVKRGFAGGAVVDPSSEPSGGKSEPANHSSGAQSTRLRSSGPSIPRTDCSIDEIRSMRKRSKSMRRRERSQARESIRPKCLFLYGNSKRSTHCARPARNRAIASS